MINKLTGEPVSEEMQNVLKRLAANETVLESEIYALKLNRMQTDLNEAHAAKGKPFEHAEELAEKSARLEQLNLELEVGKAEDVIMNDDEEQAKSAPVKTEEIGKSAPKPKR